MDVVPVVAPQEIRADACNENEVSVPGDSMRGEDIGLSLAILSVHASLTVDVARPSVLECARYGKGLQALVETPGGQAKSIWT